MQHKTLGLLPWKLSSFWQQIDPSSQRQNQEVKTQVSPLETNWLFILVLIFDVGYQTEKKSNTLNTHTHTHTRKMKLHRFDLSLPVNSSNSWLCRLPVDLSSLQTPPVVPQQHHQEKSQFSFAFRQVSSKHLLIKLNYNCSFSATEHSHHYIMYCSFSVTVSFHSCIHIF